MGREYREINYNQSNYDVRTGQSQRMQPHPPALASLYTLVGFLAASLVQYIPGSAKMLLI